MSAEDDFGVDTYQVNIGPGDCSIHLLINKNPNGKPRCLRAVMIDGGNPYKPTIADIKSTINVLESKYEFPDYQSRPNDKLRFDALVGTHWHEDHVGGLIEVVRQDIMDQIAVTPPPTTVSVSFMKYTQATPPTPETRMYFPHWERSTLTKLLRKYQDRVKESPASSRILSFNTGTPKVQKWWDNICLLEYEGILGVNFFNNQKLSNPAAVNVIADLLSNNKPDPGHPAMYCIAHDGKMFPATRSLPRIIPEADKKENWSSIAAVVMWESGKKPASGLGRISHYTAGDLPELNGEDILVDWLKDYRVISVKASHHGSRTSFPREIMSGNWKPNTIVVSSGTKHRHPTWELIHWLDLELRAQTPGAASATQVYCTCYPYYFTKRGNEYWDVKHINLEALEKTIQPFRDYQDTLDGLQNALNTNPQLGLDRSSIVDSFKKYINKSPSPSPGERRVWLVERTIAVWKNLSKVPDTAQAYSGGYSSANTSMSKADNVRFVLVESRSDANSDGRADYSFFARPPLPNARPPKRKLAPQTGNQSKRSPTANNVTNPTPQLPPPVVPPPGKRTVRSQVVERPVATIEKAMDNAAAVVATAAVADSDTRFYIYAEEVSPPDEIFHIVTSEQYIAFIEKVNRQVIVLESVLPSDSVGVVKLDDTDEVYAWLQDSLGATTSARGQHPDIQHFLLEMMVADGQNTLTFDTEATALQFDVDNIVTVVGTWGLLSNYNVMAFGLQSELSGITLGEVFSQVLEMDLPLVLEVLTGLNLYIPVPDINSPGGLFQRNAIWFIPGDDYTTVLRLQLQVSGVTALNNVLAAFLGDSFSVTTAQLVAKKTMTLSQEIGGLFVLNSSEATFVGTAQVNNMTLNFYFSFSSEGSWEAALGYDKDGLGFDEILTWLASLVNVSLDFNKWIPDDVLQAVPRFRRVTIFGTQDTTITGFRVDFESRLNFGGDGDGVTLILMSYAWPSNTLSGFLWRPPSEGDLPNVLRPNFESFSFISPPANVNVTERLSLSKLIPGVGIVGIPEQVFPYVDFASLEVTPMGITFTGTLVWDAENSSEVPIPDLATLALYTSYNWTNRSFELSLYVSVTLPQREKSAALGLPRGILDGGIDYVDGTWTLHAGAYAMNVAALYDFFDSESKDGVMDMLEMMEIEQLSLDGTFSNGRLASLVFEGVVFLGGVRADLEYSYSLSGWSFAIGLGTRSASATIGDIVGSIIGPTFVLPACVSSILVQKTPESNIFSISVEKVNDDKLGAFVIFKGNFQIGGLGFTFVQMRRTGTTQFTKRVIKVAVSELPSVTVPLVGEIPQPFDELAFLWVDDASPGAGLTRAEVQLLNTHAFPQEAGIRFKEPKTANPLDSDVVVRAGLHFLISLNLRGEIIVILDHRFGSTRTSDQSQLVLVPTAQDETQSLNTTTVTTGDSEVTKAPMGKTLGPLKITNIGLQYKNDTLYILMDASFQLGPMMMTMIGFGIGVPFDGQNTLQTLPSSLSVTLQGLGVSFERPPIIMNGLFQYTRTTDLEIYSGAMTVSFRPYTFMAAGFYGTANISLSPSNRYQTVFIFTRLTGPLVTLGFAQIAGICGGFGYNNTVQQPSIQQVSIFPFIGSNITTGPDPLEALNMLTQPGGWVTPRPDTFWLAAGLDVKALRLISLDAVVIVEFNPWVKLGIYAICRGSLPPNSTPARSFLFIEFGILAAIDFEAGIFRVEGQLSPNSFILASSCHLQGGFALFYWFNGSKYDGDWVFTVGGYHPAYTPLPHYPIPPRLGINWTVGGGISIRGESYFAITPKCCMAGGQLHLALSLGPLSAWLDAATNFLINYNPFFFMASVSISVGVAFTLDLWIVTIRIKVEIGARLQLSGPPFQGMVHVNFWVFGFDIYFGATPEPPNPVTLEDFWQMLLQQGIPERRQTTFAMKRRLQGVSSSSHVKATADTGQDHVFAIDSGLVPSSENKDDNSFWVVRAGILIFKIQSRFAIEEATCSPSDGNTAKGPNTPFYSKPMQLTTAISSKMQVTITKQEATFAQEIDEWQIEPILQAVPVAIWGIYSRETDPQVSGNNIAALLNAEGATMQLMMGASIRAPKPTLSLDRIPKFNVVHAMAQDVYESGQNPPFPPPPPEQSSAWLPAASTPDQYDKVKAQWSDPKEGRDAGKTVLASWAKALRWAAKDTVGMTGALPVRAVEMLGVLYMAAPLLSFG